MDFLSRLQNGVQITANTTPTKQNRTIDPNPVLADLRVFKDGSVYPSATLVKRYNLEYDTSLSGNGFDVVESTLLPNTSSSEVPFLMIYAVSKQEPKVDLFGSARFDNGKTPSVMTQGSNTFGRLLLEMIKTTYGIELKEDEKYIDLSIVNNEEFSDNLQKETNGVYNIPKRVMRGSRKGEATYIRRENITMNWLVPYVLTNTTNEVEMTTVETKKNSEELVTTK